MARSRNIKPGFFKNEVLGEMPPLYRLLFIGLWTHADREGRFECRPRKIKAEVFPYDDVNIEDGLAALEESGFLVIYAVDGLQYVQIQNWGKHQNPHHKEVGSTIPAPEGHTDKVCAGYIPLSNTIRRRIYARDGRKCRACGAEHGLSIDHIIPISKGGNSTDDNLQVLCLGCNVLKGNRIPTKEHDQFMHASCMNHAHPKEIGSCPTDSLIPDSLTLIPDAKKDQKTLRPSLREDADTELAELLADIPADLLRDYKKVRKAKKAALTARAVRGLIEAGRKGGKTLVEVLEICCAESWVGYNHTWPRANARDAPIGGTGMARADSPQQPNGKTVSAIIALEELKNG